MSTTFDEIRELFREIAEDRRKEAEEWRKAEEERREAQRRAEQEWREALRKAEEERLEAQRKAEEERREAQRRAEEERLEAQRKAEEERRKSVEEWREIKEAQKETDRKFQETDRKFQETDKQLKELGKQIGGLGEKFGSFTEGLALPSMEKILRERFGMEVISPSVRVSKAGQHLEIDVLAYANGPLNQVYVVEVKSHPREESITQISNLLTRFRNYFPEHRDKQVFGILAAVDMSAALRERALRQGLYVARIHDNVFELDIPDDFQPRAY